MKKLLFALVLSLTTSVFSQKSLDYFFNEKFSYNPDIPTPEEIIGHAIGEYHISYDKLIRYMEVLAEKSDRVSLHITGYSHEQRPLMLVIITAPENQGRLEKIRKDHLESIHPKANKNISRDEFLIAQLGYSVHGNEPSGVNAAPLMAYYLAASTEDFVKDMLEKSVILIEPGLNPDGINRFASWVNSHKSLHNNPDPSSLEFHEAWPGSRTNHYWYDLNRDWLFLQHPESQARIQAYHQWKPHVLTDHHEMGSNSTFFFQPGVKSRNNPVVPESNYFLTQKIGTYHARALDQIGSLYYSEENFDDFYFGKGSAYPDLNGGIGILFEQASSRGHLRETAYGLMSFEFTIRNQVITSLSTIQAAWELRKELQFHQEEFYTSALTEAEENPVKGYIFSSPTDPMRAAMMVDILLQHDVAVLPLSRQVSVNGVLFPEESSFVIDAHQAQFRMIRTLMESVTTFADSTFYDISAWTLPLAMGVDYAALDAKDLNKLKTGKPLTQAPGNTGTMESGIADQAYLFEWDPYLAPKALFEILEAGLLAKVANEPFVMLNDNGEQHAFDYGTILIPVQPQTMNNLHLQSFLYNIANENGLHIFPVNSAWTVSGPDLGSGRFSFLQLPKTLMITGGRGSSREAGQIWHLFDTRFNIPVTMVDGAQFSRVNLSKYNTILLPSGSYQELGERGIDQLKNWTRSGGKIIALRSANNFLKSAGLINFDYQQAGEYPDDGNKFKAYAGRRSDYVGRSIPGSIFQAHLDLTHPIGYGYNNNLISIFKNSTSFVAPNDSPYGNPVYFTKNPLLSGYINEQNLSGLKESVVVQGYRYGSGQVVSFFEDPFFRGYFAGEHKLFLNAIFFGF